jgi:hypothetical protein
MPRLSISDAKYDYNSCDGLEHNQFPAQSCSVTNGPYAQSEEFHQDVEYRLASEDFQQRCIATTLFVPASEPRISIYLGHNVFFAPLTGGPASATRQGLRLFCVRE